MGRFMAASAAAHNPQVKAAVLISAWNIGSPRPVSEAEEAKALASDGNLVPLAGTSGEALAHEEFTHRQELDRLHLASRIAPRPVLFLTANDHSNQFPSPFATALKSATDSRISTRHLDSDQSLLRTAHPACRGCHALRGEHKQPLGKGEADCHASAA